MIDSDRIKDRLRGWPGPRGGEWPTDVLLGKAADYIDHLESELLEVTQQFDEFKQFVSEQLDKMDIKIR